MDDVGGRRRISEEASMTRVLGVLMLSAPLLLGAPHAAAATITPANVGRLALKWDFPGGTITGGPAFANGEVYAGAWNGNVYALDPHTGVARWTTASGSSIQGPVLPLPDGRICFGDATARVTCLDAEDGSQLWRTQIGDPAVDNIWSAPAVDLANNRIYVGIASHTDNPCTKGQLVALNLETGAQLWSLQTVPDKVCEKDTGMSCDDASDCPGNTRCVGALGAGVTASPIVSPDGDYVYMNTVGCFTFPSVGDSDSMFKVEAATGNVVWKKRVNQPEQFGFCEDDPSVDCGSNAMCSTGVCRQRCIAQSTVSCQSDADCPGAGNGCRGFKSNYHDFGFLNGPLLIEAAHGKPTACDTNTLVVSGSKNGTLYAFCETDGQIVWERAVQPTPISPGFAGFGLFNGAIAYADGRIFAALNNLIPSRVCDNDHAKGCASDGDCASGTCLPEPEHLMAFQATNGSTVWSDEIGRSWGHVRVENGVVYSGTGTFFNLGGPSEVYAYDAANGTRLGTFPLPIASAARPLVVDDTLFVGYGLIGGGGIRAFSLCGNGDLDDGEQCDDAGAGDCCAPDCTFATAGSECNDGVFCTAQDTCDDSGTCGGTGNPCAGTACEVCQEDLDRCVDENGTPCSTTTTTAVPLCRSAADCDDGNPCTADACDPASGCTRTPAAGACSDGDDCTADSCVAGACVGDISTPDGVTCAYDQLAAIECDGDPLPKKLRKTITKKVKRSRKLFDKATDASQSGNAEKATTLLGKSAKQLDAILSQVDKAVASPKPSKSITADCGNQLRSLVQNRQQVVGGYVF
jgi:outer membrane protein assembly factor BamB